MASATTGGTTMVVSDVKVGDLLFAPEQFPVALWGEVVGIFPTSSPTGYLDFLMVENSTEGRANNNRQTATIKIGMVARVRRPPPAAPEPAVAPNSP